jgi:hypothetical protein
MKANVLDNDPSRPWISITANLPDIGTKVEVWTLVDRTAEEDEQACGEWHADEGLRLPDGRFLVGQDYSAMVTHWRALATGPKGN